MESKRYVVPIGYKSLSPVWHISVAFARTLPWNCLAAAHLIVIMDDAPINVPSCATDDGTIVPVAPINGEPSSAVVSRYRQWELTPLKEKLIPPHFSPELIDLFECKPWPRIAPWIVVPPLFPLALL